jgi:hypothetical protein
MVLLLKQDKSLLVALSANTILDLDARLVNVS